MVVTMVAFSFVNYGEFIYNILFLTFTNISTLCIYIFYISTLHFIYLLYMFCYLLQVRPVVAFLGFLY